MTLDGYLKRADATPLTALAAEMGVSKGRLSQLRDSTDWPPELALKAEIATGGRVSASDLSPVVALARRMAVPSSAEAA
jgi:DNA-binding transcriptional regulator YdaS (Cro superfamily)